MQLYPLQHLTEEHLLLAKAFSKSCRRTILKMVAEASSGHPGGSLSSLDILTTLYLFRLIHTQEDLIVSNGHISPAVYSVLAELKVIPKHTLIKTFRKLNSPYEGHITRHVPGIPYGTGPLGCGVSVAAGMAIAEKRKQTNKKVFALMGDGEAQEGQVHEMLLFAAKEHLDNFILFCDYNQVQLSDSLEKVLPINLEGMFASQGWEVLTIDGHDYEAIYQAMQKPQSAPRLVLAKTIMGKGIPFMEKEGAALHSTWHGKAPDKETVEEALKEPSLTLTEEEASALETFHLTYDYTPPTPVFPEDLSQNESIKIPPMEAALPSESIPCRKAYGKALLALAKENPQILAASADVSGSVMTKGVEKELPAQYLEFGICEQNMVSAAGGLSLKDFVPFVSTFGAFMTSRAKDQARLNDINQTNVKMVSTHCGLSVGEDGPTHQVLDDMGSFLGFFHTYILEPADANHCEHLTRFIAGHFGNFYMRMGRHAIPIIPHPDNPEKPLFDEHYQYYFGRTDIAKKGTFLTLVASGSMVSYALKVAEKAKKSIEVIIASTPQAFDDTLKTSLQKTKRLFVVEDHNEKNGYSTQLAAFALKEGIPLKTFQSFAPRAYQFSGKPAELYHAANIDDEAILKALEDLTD